MSSLEKRHTSRRGSMHGHHKYSDGFSDTSSVGSFMDETDREVSNLTDRAFRSLCIGEEAIYNDSEISSPTERHKAFDEEVHPKEVVKTTCQETFSYGIQYKEAERKSEVTSTFQHSYMDVAQEQVLRDECMSYMSNGSMEATWQQKRSTSRVSSLIKAFSSREGYCDSGISDAVLLRDKYRDFNNGSWDKSALLSFQRDLSEISSAYQQNFKSGPFQSYRNHFHASASAVSRMDTTASLVKSSKTKFHALNSTNFFFHSEFSPFQLWKDYNRFPFEREEPSGFVSASEFPRWYDSPLYKELTTTQTFSSEGRRFNRRKIEDVVPTQRSRSTVIQKASAIEKRCESEMASNCPPWKRNNNFVRSKLSCNRPSTVSPTNEKAHRPDSSLLSYNRYTFDIQHKEEKVGGNELSGSSTPFSITQLLTPVIHGRQETETSEILQFAHTPSVPDYCVQGDVDLKPLAEVKQLRDSYKSRASSLLFNLKDNRKRVKSTYSPKFKGLEITDRNKQSSKLEDLESRLSDSSASQVTTQEHSAVPDMWEHDVAQQTYDVHLSQTVEHKEYTDGLRDMTLTHQNAATNHEFSYEGSQGSSLHPYKLPNKENEEYEFSPHMLPAQNKSIEKSEGHIHGPSGTLNPTRPGTENAFSKAHPLVHSLTAQMSEKQTFGRREDMGHHDFTERQNFVTKSNFGYTKNQVTEERLSWENSGHINITSREMFNNDGIKDSLPFKGEIANLIEMDKQRKATANQYLPSANDSYTMGKETYINKVNENIKQGRLAKEEEVQDTECASQKYPYTSKPAQYNPTNTSSASQNVYGFYNNGLHKMSLSPPKDSKFTRNSEFRSTTHDEVRFQRNINMNMYAASDITTERDYSQKVPCSTSLEEKHQKSEGSVAYQPYKYEPNKQWHIATTENRCTIDDVHLPRQLQTEKISQQPDETHYPHSVMGMPDIHHKNMTYTKSELQDRLRAGEHQPDDSMIPKQIYQTKHGDMKSDIKKLNIQNTEPNNSSSHARGDKFSINDILSIRDNEQAKRLRENKHSLTASVSDPTKLENVASVVASVVAEEKAAKTDVFNVKEQQTTEDPTSHYKLESAYGYIRKESHNRNEGLANIDTATKDKTGKERTLSYKEKGQTKQEILTSKLKAHAQKEISAIKERGLAKQGILSRNSVKQSITVNTDKEQMSQDVMSPKKEITAEKLNHLFQDITYSSVTSYKEHRNQDKDGPKYETLTAEEIKSPTRAVGPWTEVAFPEKNNEAVKDDRLTTNEKERTKVQPHTQRIQLQDERITVVDRNTFQFSKFSTDNHKTLNHETVPAKSLLSSPAIKSPNKEASVVKTAEQASNLPTVYSAGPTEHKTFVEKGMDSTKYIFGKTATCSLTSYNDSEQTKLRDLTVNTTEQPSKVKVDNLTASRVTTHLECTDLAETTILPVVNQHQSQSNPGKETSIKEVYEKKFGPSSSQVNSLSDWTRFKAEALPVESTMESADTKAGLPTKRKAYSTKEGEQGKSEDDIVCDDTSSSANIKLPKTPEAKEKENLELCAKQNIMVQIDSTPKTNESSAAQQLQHVDAPKVKTFESAYRNKGKQTPSNSNKEEKMKLVSPEVNEQSPLKELNQKKDENIHSEKDEAQELSQSMQEISSANYQTNSPEVKTVAVTASSDQKIQQDSDGPPGSENQTQNEKDLHEQKEIASEEMKQSNDKSIVNKNDSSPTGVENEMSPEKPHTATVTVNNKDKQMNNQTVQDNSSDISLVPESQVIHIPSNEDNTSANEPVIYSICVSSKSDAVSEDEPVIYTICVSSITDNSLTDVPVCQEKSSFAQKQLLTEGAEKEEETSGSKNEETKTEETDYHESNASDDKQSKGLFDTDKAEKETMVRKYDSPATKDKQDYHRSSEVNNISSSYESLLVKYGLAVREDIHLKPKQKEKDKLQGKETEIHTNNFSENVQKNSLDNDCASAETVNTDVSGRLGQESRKPKLLEAVTEFLGDDKENNQYISHSVTANGGLTKTAAGVVACSDEDITDKRQFTPENCKPQNEQGITEKQTPISEAMPNCEDNQNTRLTVDSEQYTKNDSVELKGKKQVGQKLQAVDFARENGQKEKESDKEDSKIANTVLVESESDNQNINHPAAEISYANISNNTTVIGSPSQKDSGPPNSKTSETATEDSKVCETIDKKVAQTYSCNSVSTQDTEVYLYKHKPDIPPAQNQQKTITERINADIPEMVSKELASSKGSKASQNRKEFVWKNEFSDKEQDKFKTSNELKDRKEVGITAFSSKQIVKENCSVSEHPHNKASNVMKTDQSLFKTPSIPLEDKVVNKNELIVNKDIVTVQGNPNSQQEQIKTDSVSAKDVVLSGNAISQNTTFQKVTEQKSLYAMSTAEDGSKRLDIQKTKLEPAPSQKESMKNEVTAVNKDNAKKALYSGKVEKDTEGEINKGDMNLKEETAEPQDKKDDVTIDNVRKDDGQTKSKVGSLMVKDSNDSIRKEVASSVKHDDRINVYQYHPGKGFLPETKRSLYDEQSSVGFSHHDAAFKKKESTSRKSEVTQRDKKTTRPEISALADYARLRVISAEDDSTSEKDLLEKIDTYHKYNLSALAPQKGVQGNQAVSLGGTEPKRELTVKKHNDSQTTKPFQANEKDRLVLQRNKITEGILEGHDQHIPRDETVAHPKLSSLAKRSDDRVFAVKEKESTKEKRLANQIQSDTKTALTERSHEIHQTPNPQVQGKNTQVEGKNVDSAMLRQPVHAKCLGKDVHPHVKNQESLPQVTMGSILNKANKQANNQNIVQPEINEGEKVEELEYYTVSTTKSQPKPKEIHGTVSFSDRTTSKKEATENPTAWPRSNSCSPAMGKPTMFKVKDNTIRTSSVSRADKPWFHRSFSEEFRIGSPKEIWRSSEKCELEHGHEHNPKESENPPVLHDPAVASHRLPRAREVQPQNSLSSEFTAAKEPRSYQRRSQVFEDDETRSVVSTMSEDVESFAGSFVGSKENTSHVFERKSNRDTYVRPESACYIRPESACYERPESVCYERPESACSDMRSLGKPPAVPPKSEKALRRAKKLTTRRIQKAEAKLTSENQGQLETKSLRAVSSLPSSPMELLSTHHAVHPSPPISHYHVEPNYAPPAPSLMAHPFPMTQRKLLQDPNSGQYFMVDMPVPVKTKTFFDPETGKYVQLNVRQRTQGTLSQPQPVLNHSYVVYPGFLPMSVSSLPSMRSSSQMSAPATVVEDQNKLEASRDPWRSETYQPNYHKNTQEYNEAVHGTHANSGRESLYTDNNVNIASRHTDIITMSELEDFAMEST